MWLSDRVLNIRPSGVRRIFDLARTIKDPIDLSLGEPDFDMPSPIKEEGIRWIRQGFNKYTPSGGIPELRCRIRDCLLRKGIACEDVIITPGVTGGLLLAFMVTLNPADEVVIPDPYFVLYEYQVILLGGKPVFFDTYPDFTLKEAELRGAISDRTKIHPHQQPQQPNGHGLFEGGDGDGAAAVAREKNLLVFSDDIYDRFAYDGGEPPGLFRPGLREHADLRRFFEELGHDGVAHRLLAGPK